MIVYIIKTTVCALLLYAVYIALLEREKMHRFKRAYLLGSLVFSLIVPFAAFTITVDTPQLPANFQRYAEHVWIQGIARNDAPPIVVESAARVEETSSAASSVNYSLLILGVYALITSGFLFRMMRNSCRMIALGRKHACVDYRGAKIALMDEKTVPHSFGRYIFVNRGDYDNGRVANEILTHEWAHVSQRHTWDIVFIEALIAFGWFNPVFYLYRNKIRQNHEFLADEAVVRRSQTYVPAYQTLLMNYFSQNKNVILTSNFNFNFLIAKKRIVMMTKTTSKKRAWLRYVALVPVFIIASCVFSSKSFQDDQMITPGKGVSQELLDEFKEKWEKAKIYTKSDRPIIERGDTVCIFPYSYRYDLSGKEWDRLFVIYVQMNEQQRKEQDIAFAGPTFSNPFTVFPKSHSVPPEVLKFWEDMPDFSYIFPKYEIWVDGVKLKDWETLKYTYANTDFAAYFVSQWQSRGRTINDSYRIYLWTTDGYDEFIKRYFDKPISIDKLLEIKPRISTRSGNSFFFRDDNVSHRWGAWGTASGSTSFQTFEKSEEYKEYQQARFQENRVPTEKELEELKKTIEQEIKRIQHQEIHGQTEKKLEELKKNIEQEIKRRQQ